MLLDRVREVCRLRHFSPRTEKAYVGWIRRFLRFHRCRHPREMGAPDVEAFLSSLARQPGVAASTQNQALSGLLFLYTDDARAALYAAIESQESRHVIDALRRFSEVLAKNAPNCLAAPVKPFVWGIGGVVVYFAAPAVLPALGVAKGSEEVIVRLLNKYRDRVIASRVVELASTLGLTRGKD